MGEDALQPAGLCIENEFYIFQEASRQSKPACVYSVLFPTDESKASADTTESHLRGDGSQESHPHKVHKDSETGDLDSDF